MDGSLTTPLHFPVAMPPGTGETITIAPGVEWLRMPLPFALDHINLWLLEDGPGWTIVDAGYATAETTARWERILPSDCADCRSHGSSRRITIPIISGSPGGSLNAGRPQLWTSEKEWLFARLMTGSADDSRGLRRDFARRAGFDEAASELFAEHHQGYRRGVPSVPSSFRRLADGLVVEIGGREWRVIIGEGHSPELACLYCAETGVLISGDQVLPKISPNVSVQAHEPDSDPLSRFLRSLDMLRCAVPPGTLVLPSHNLPFSGLHTRIDDLAAHHRARCAEIIAACGRPQSAMNLLPVLFRRPLDRHQMAFALGEALAHLHYLMGQGALTRVLGSDGVNRFIREGGSL